jgi:D-alanyl-D-alanine carboxypeptidase
MQKGILSNAKVFKAELFKSNIAAQLQQGGALGYALVINEKGQIADSASFGIGGVNPSGSGSFPASVLNDINIASVTKPLTCIAAIKLLQKKGIDIDFEIGVWLPSYWKKSSDIIHVTFRELLTHTSGIQQTSSSWDSLKSAAARTVGPKTFFYSNANFALFRAILPKLNDLDGFNKAENNSTAFESWMSNEYIRLMQELVFTPAGLSNINCRVNTSNNTCQMLNELNNPPLIPRNTGDWTETCGGGGFYLTTLEMAQIMAFLAHTEAILTNAQKVFMDNNLLGWDPNDTFNSNYGRVYGKDGALFSDNNNDNSVSSGDSGLQTWVGKFPNGVELALSVNSIGSTTRSLSTIARLAYEAAWVDK